MNGYDRSVLGRFLQTHHLESLILRVLFQRSPSVRRRNHARRVILSKIVKILGHSMMEDWLVSPKGKNFQIKELKH
jgi:hypothetical protein